MNRTILVILLFIAFNATAQEKRLALVIGNANYDKGALKNPVNDALLMQRTLTELGFEVLLDTNIRTLDQFKRSFRQFTTKRDSFNLGLIYYAGHGIQINGANYLLATNQEYNSESDVMDYAFEVSRIIDYLKSRNKEVNLLILDACRDNPFEKLWTTTSRSLEKGNGLAAMPPPSGSLVAYSTQPGSTASDGNGKNSLYCEILTENLLKEDLTINQLFRNVKMEVRTKSEGKQMPNVLDELEGSEVILRKGTYMNQVLKADSLIEANKLDDALEIISNVLGKDPNNLPALLRKGRIKYRKDAQSYDGADLFKAEKLYPNNQDVQIYLAEYFSMKKNHREAISKINNAIRMDSANADCYYWRAVFYTEIEKLDSAITDYTKAIELDKNNALLYYKRGVFYTLRMEDYPNALVDFSRAIELEPTQPIYWHDRGALFADYLAQPDKSLLDYKMALYLKPDYVEAINRIGVIYQNQGKPELAIAEYEKGITLSETNPQAAAYCYSNRAAILVKQKKYDLALADYNKSVELDNENALWYYFRGVFFALNIEDYQNALIDLSRAIELEPTQPIYWHDRGALFADYLAQPDKSLSDYKMALYLKPDYVGAINRIGVIYENQGKPELAIAEYEKGIALAETNPEAAAFCYSNRADIYSEQGKLELALADYTQAVKIDLKNATRYQSRGVFYMYKIKDYQLALMDLTKAIELDSTSSTHRYNRGILYWSYLGETNKAIVDYKKALDLKPDYIDAINGIGVIYKNQGKPDLAIVEYEKGIAMAESNPEAAAYCYSNRADIYSEQGKLELALADYTQAVKIDLKNATRYQSRGVFYMYKKKDYQLALMDLTKAIELDSTSSTHRYNRGILYWSYLGETNKAIEDFNKALEIQPDFVDAINYIGVIYKREGKNDLAVNAYEKGIRFEKNNPVAAALCYTNRAAIYADQNKLELALADFNKAIEIDSDNAVLYKNRGVFFIDYLRDYKKALIDFSKAIELDPTNYIYWYNRGFLLEKHLNKSQEAISDFKKTLEINSSIISAINWIGNIYRRFGEFDLAIKEYEKGIALEKTNPKSAAFCYSNRADLYVLQNKIELALIDYNNAIKIDNKTADLYAKRGMYYRDKLRQYDKALTDLNRAIELDSTNCDLFIERGKIFAIDLNDFKLGLMDFEKALEFDTNDVIILNCIGALYDRFYDKTTALKYYDLTISKIGHTFKDSVWDYRNGIAWAFSNKGGIMQNEENHIEASYNYTKAIEMDVENPERYIYRAWHNYAYLNNLKDAESDVKKATQLDKENQGYYYIMSMINEKSNDQSAAIKNLNKVVELSEEDPDILSKRAMYYLRQRKYDLAINDLKQVTEKYPEFKQINYSLGNYYKTIDSTEKAIYYYTTAVESIKNDTTGNFLLGELYFDLKQYQKALIFYSKAMHIMELRNDYSLDTDPFETPTYLSDIYYKIALSYTQLNSENLSCEYFHKSLNQIARETRPDKTGRKKELADLMSTCCKN